MFNTDDITVILAGAGCGKTSEIELQVEALLEHYLPNEIALVSFTRKGASEGRERIKRRLDLSDKDLPFMETLHTLTYRALGYTSENIFGREDADRFNSMLGFHLTNLDYYDVGSTDDLLLSNYDKVRAGVDVEEVRSISADLEYKRLVEAYNKYKSSFKKIDFTDCLINYVKDGEPLPVRVAIMDEVQDFNTIMWEVVYKMFGKAEKVIMAGDDYQSIYKYAGARPDVLIDFAKNYHTIKLEKSYRLSKSVYRYAKAVTDMISEKVDKDYRPVKSTEGSVSIVADRDFLANKINATQDETWLVLFRNNHYIDDFADYLRRRMVLFHDNRGFCIPDYALSRIKKYYNFRKKGYKDDEAKRKFMEFYSIPDIDMDFADTNLIQGEKKYVYQMYVDHYGIERVLQAAKNPRVVVSTIHRVKGAEARNVALFLDCSKRTYMTRYDDFDAELRLLYVAITRAITNLYFVASQSRYGYDDIIQLLEENIQLC